MFGTKAMSAQLMTCGRPIDVTDHLRPKRSVIKLYRNVPNAPPIHSNELIQADWSIETGPVSSGDSLDNKMGTLGEAQPKPSP